METMTEEEAFALDEHYTKNPPSVDPGKARFRIPLIRLDEASAAYITAKARETNKTPTAIISEMVQKELTAVGKVLVGTQG